jgi:hypothetical protein
MGRRGRVLSLAASAAAAPAHPFLVPGSPSPAPAAAAAEPPKCLACHRGIEEMHPKSPVGCVECHGGDPTKERKEEAHVVPRFPLPNDERVVPAGFDPAVLRFRNPMDLRIVSETCGTCHADEVDRVPLSLHATTTGHLGDGLYENGVTKERHPRVGVFAATDRRFDPATAPPGAVRSVQRIGAFKSAADPRSIATHFSDVPRKACMACHLWSEGRAVKGRLGMDGDYRGEGCAACHVRYEDDGISRSGDASVPRNEAGHPARHSMQRVPGTETCTRCHYGDASIGLTFRGLAQPVPGMPQSPDAPGFAPKRLNGVFYVKDPAVNPPDLHHARGMQCADCHTGNDVMGDGHIYARMEDAVEISCETCHGTPDRVATGLSDAGRAVRGLNVGKDGVFLHSRSDGTIRRVKQARDVVDPNSPDYNPRAALAMTSDHERLRCYACHTGWSPNFFGFHFDRNEGFTQLDLLDGERTQGRVSTQEKVFATFKQHYLGWDSHGAVAPYMVGFSTMATVHAEDGSLLLDQEMPVTSAGLSGMTMIHHQPHATTAQARRCVECHRAPVAWGHGSVNFRLAREIVMVAGDTGVQIVGFDRKTPANTRILGRLAVPDVRAFDVRSDDLQGRAAWGYAATGEGEIWTLDLRNPLFPKAVQKLEDAVEDPRDLLVAEDLLFVADAKKGVLVLDTSVPAKPKQVAAFPIDSPGEAKGLFLDGPWLYVAAGSGGLYVLDVSDPAAPTLLSRTLIGDRTQAADARSVSVMFQFSRPNPADPSAERLPPRGLAVLSCGGSGVAFADVTRPERPVAFGPLPVPGGSVDATLGTIFELGSEGGGIASREVDFAFVLSGNGVILLDVSNTAGPPVLRSASPAGNGIDAARGIKVTRVYNPPFLQTYVLVAGSGGLGVVEVTSPAAPVVRATVRIPGTAAVSAEEFPLDRMIDSRGRPLKDVSHEGARYLDAAEIRRVLTAPVR